MDLPEWAYEGVDVTRPSAARIYDFLLGGSHNFAADREVARLAMEAMPDVAVQARANRDFLHRAVRFAVHEGVHQFLDLGSGIPTVGSVHDIAERDGARVRVVYVDIDQVAVAHGRQILSGNEHAAVVEADFRRPEEILADPQVQAVLDFRAPVAVLLVAVLHAVSDADDPAGALCKLREVLVPDSLLVIAHGTDDSRPDESANLVKISQRTTTPMTMRSRDEIAGFFDGFDLVEPGLTWAPAWRPDPVAGVPEHPERSGNIVGVGRLR
jgi:SAM-dependent methyltransferase